MPGLVPAAGAAGQGVLIEIEDIATGELEARGFELDGDQAVRIEATDLEARHHFGELTAAWILDARTRRVVWKMGDSKPVREYRGLRDYDDEVRLGAGAYEVYFATYPDEQEINEDEGWWRNAGRAIRRFAEEKILRREEYDEAAASLRLVIRGSGRALEDDELERGREALRREAVVAQAPVGDEEARERGFEILQDVDVEIYALGELSPKSRYDYGWIVDTATRRKVWDFAFESSLPAGGGAKNRQVRLRMRLPAGRYAAFFVSDDSHSADQWTTLPPYDPDFWGLTIRVTDSSRRQLARAVEYRDLPADRIIVELTKLRNDESERRGISIAEPIDVRIYAVGEGFESGMADYGWILDAHTRETVWSMGFAKTTHAGGSKKNRLADEVVRFEPGDYVVAFRTDGSHAYGSWNSKPPLRAEQWGITLFLASEADDASKVTPYVEEYADSEVIARISRVTNDRRMTRSFTLEAARRVTVYAVGEGADGRMYDYAWLEDGATGQVIWEMVYEATGHAGGASKNRVLRETLDLEAGEYLLRYRSDDSHSYGHWNSSPPHDPESWGARITLESP